MKPRSRRQSPVANNSAADVFTASLRPLVAEVVQENLVAYARDFLTQAGFVVSTPRAESEPEADFESESESEGAEASPATSVLPRTGGRSNRRIATQVESRDTSASTPDAE